MSCRQRNHVSGFMRVSFISINFRVSFISPEALGAGVVGHQRLQHFAQPFRSTAGRDRRARPTVRLGVRPPGNDAALPHGISPRRLAPGAAGGSRRFGQGVFRGWFGLATTAYLAVTAVRSHFHEGRDYAAPGTSLDSMPSSRSCRGRTGSFGEPQGCALCGCTQIYGVLLSPPIT